MLVQWSSADAGAPEVRWGTAADKLDRVTAAESATYGRGDMCGPPASTDGWLDPGLLHRAVLSGLAPDTEYFYYYGDEVRASVRWWRRLAACPEKDRRQPRDNPG